MSQKIVIADNFAVFRAGIARFIVVEDEFSIVGQCDDLARLYRAAETVTGAVIVFAASLQPNLAELQEKARLGRVRLVAVLEMLDSAKPYARISVPGILYRDVSRAELLKCVRAVANGGAYVQQPPDGDAAHLDSDQVGERARNRLSRKELQVVRLIVQGYKNKDIATELGNSEQVIKNYLRSIFDKTGVSDRLELALFTLHHRILLDAANDVDSAPDRRRLRTSAP